jgi:sodium/hydrogen antiporter
MVVILAFSITLLFAVLLSGLAQRSVLSTAVLFLIAGFILGNGVLALVPLQPHDPVVARFTELALFSVLLTEGMRIPLSDLRSAWQLPGRALLLGMPITIVVIAVLARLLCGLSWVESFLVGAALSPTDPVFAAAVVGREEVPQRLRHLLNVESGVNDGLALPLVVTMLAALGSTEFDVLRMLGELALGVALGLIIHWIAVQLERSRFFSAASNYAPLTAFAVGLLVLATAPLAHANEFLAAFSSGIMLATVGPHVRDQFKEFGELIAELLKLAALLAFGALISLQFLADVRPTEYVFALLVLLVARPFALAIALLGSRLDWREWAAAAWFGPKGLALSSSGPWF